MGVSLAHGREAPRNSDRRLLIGLTLSYAMWWTWLAIEPLNRRDWLLENLLALTAVALLILTHRRFQLSTISYILIAVFMTLHAVGAHYTYAEVPFGFWLKDTFGLSRNPFDRIVHFAFGATWVYPVREGLTRLAGVRGLWAYYLPVSAILAQSAFFEVVEAVVADLVSPELGSVYLGTQGDEWDAQKDMASALLGAVVTMIVTFNSAKSKAKTPILVPR